MKGLLIIVILTLYICAIATLSSRLSRASTNHPIPIDKDTLVKKAAEFDKTARDVIAKYTKLNLTGLVSNIYLLDASIVAMAEKIKTNTVVPLEVLESNLFWLEQDLYFEIRASEQVYHQVGNILSNVAALDARIAAGITKVGADTPVGIALAEEKVELAIIAKGLREANNERPRQLLEFDFVRIEERVIIELAK